MRTRTAPVAALLFGSGFCALVYQVAWLREFRLIFGASTAASAAVTAIFIGGLGLGCLFATFFLLEVYGTRATVWLAAAINLLIAVSARVVDRRAVDHSEVEREPFRLRGTRRRTAVASAEAVRRADAPENADRAQAL